MRKILNLVIGGLQQKIFNLVLVTILLVVGAYTAVIVYQANHLSQTIRDAEVDYSAVDVEVLENIRSSLAMAERTIVVLLIIILILSITAALILAKRIVKPINTMTRRVAGLDSDNLQFMMEDVYRTGDEIEILASAFADLSAKTTEYINQITTITAEKERIGAELDMAKAIQESQLPNIFPAFPGRQEFDIYATMTPAKEVGGDFYDFFLVDEDHLAMVMADVSGKGVPAALFMMISKILIKNRLQSGESPGKALENVNDQLLEGNQTDMFVTVWLGVVEISTGRGIAVNAGHEHPVLKRKEGSYELIKYRHSPAVGTIEGLPFPEHEFQMEPGDALFVYTDGVAEATNEGKELFGTQRLLDTLNGANGDTPEQTLQAVMEGIETFVAGAEQFDDITMLCLKYIGGA